MPRCKPTKCSAGILLISNGRFLVLRRGKNANNPRLWDLPGGQRDEGERADETAWREAGEEIGHLPRADVTGRILVLRDGGKKRYDVFVCATSPRVRKRWQPQIDGEHSAFRWVDVSWCVARRQWLHPVLRSLLDDPQARKALQKAVQGKRGIRERIDRWTDGICLRPEPSVV
jgi:8-oxo-dGTP pyrophosphatase MutT (NUDIX family)